MPLARAAELHQQVRETPVIEEIIIPEVATETADRVPQSTDVNDGNTPASETIVVAGLLSGRNAVASETCNPAMCFANRKPIYSFHYFD